MSRPIQGVVASVVTEATFHSTSASAFTPTAAMSSSAETVRAPGIAHWRTSRPMSRTSIIG